MKTKATFIVLILLGLFTGGLHAQQYNEDSRVSLGILGGVNFQTFNGEDGDGDKLENDMIVGYHAGINLAIPIAPQFYFQPGLLLSMKGAKNTGFQDLGTYNLSYIEVPMNLVYKGLVGTGYVLVGFGPYIAYAVKGKADFEAGSLSYEPDVEFANEVDLTDPILTSYFKPFDAGANIFVGYQLSQGLFFQLNGQLGLMNINPEDNRLTGNNSKYMNTGYGISLGYQF
jgi:hypothetical protein